MGNTTTIYNAVQRFISIRDQARADYEKRMTEIQRFKGSAGYDAEQKKTMTQRLATVEAARAECEKVLVPAFTSMMEKNNARTVAAPSEEEIRLLQAVSMMTKPSLATLDSVSRAMKSPLALAALDDIATRTNDKGHPVTAYAARAADELAIDKGDEAIKVLRNKCTDILRNVSGANHTRLASAQHNKKRYGVDYDADSFEREKPYTGESDFLQRELGTSADIVALFQNAVN